MLFSIFRYFDTTQKVDYQPPYPYTPKVIQNPINGLE